MKVEIWSDVVCPWCYIGKRRFERALERFDGAADVEIVWRSFQLNPTHPKGLREAHDESLARKLGATVDQVHELNERVVSLAAAEGLEYHLSEDGVTGNTFDAHRLLQLAGSRGRQDAAVERLFRAYFTEGRSVFEPEALTPLAVEAGLDEAEVREVLAGDAYADAVAADMREARALGVNGVPFFVIDRRFGVSGAQATEVFAQTLARARSHRAAS